MIEQITKNIKEFLEISPYENALITKMKYNFKLSKYDKIKLWLLREKIFCIKMLRLRGRI